ncbi:hypothetical protein SEA_WILLIAMSTRONG_42 [Microbacterium phage WilliamStrong]|nr:hypothetical protein SEA_WILLIAMSTRONG_42 [Microbacterium phage WilliamStrong]
MDITLEVCKDTYVTSCTPAPKVDLPECEDGWELGNGTAVCATQQPTNLATTGGGSEPLWLLGVVGVLLVVGLALWVLGRRH